MGDRSSIKRINLILKADIKSDEGEILYRAGTIMRTTRSYALRLVTEGLAITTSKGKLKSFLNKSLKLYKNEKFLKQFDLTDKKVGHLQIKDEDSGRGYVLIKRREVEVVMQGKETDPKTGKPVEIKVMKPVYQAVITSYPANS